MNTAKSAAEALARYKAAMKADTLVQGTWSMPTDDGKTLVCGLGVIGGIQSAKDCPAQIMPRWLAKMVPWLFDGQDFDDAISWGLKFYAQLSRLDGAVPFSAVHDWRASVVAPVAIEAAKLHKKDTKPHIALRNMHKRALSGENSTREQWINTLRPVCVFASNHDDPFNCADPYNSACANAYAYACPSGNVDAYIEASADAYTTSNAKFLTYSDLYAKASSYANASACVRTRTSILTWCARGLNQCLSRVPVSP